MENTSQQNLSIEDIKIGSLLLESGEKLPNVSLRYERVGPKDAPTILVCHALTGNHVTVGNREQTGWWNSLIGDQKYIDTRKYQVLTFNALGGCNGSTGPMSINPKTNEAYRMNFPRITIRDMVQANYKALELLDIRELYAVTGGSLGGMQALEWGILYPTLMKKLILLAVTPTLSDYGVAFNHIAEQAIKSDPSWQKGNYDSNECIRGLEIARMIGMVTYRSAELFAERFQRKELESGYSVTSYLNYQGRKLAKRFDTNSYLYLLDAMNSHDIGRERGGWKNAVQQYTSRILAVSYESDLIYEPKEIQEFANHAPNCRYHHVQTQFGHDGFLTEYEKWGMLLTKFLEEEN